MNANSYRDLSWLVPCPADFALRCRAATELSGNFGSYIQHLAGHALDDNQLIRLSKTITAGRAKGFSLAPLTSCRLGLIGNGTTDFIAAALPAAAARHGLALETVATGYNQALQDSLSADSLLYRTPLDVVLIALDSRALPLRPQPGDAVQAQAGVEASLDYIDSIRDAVHRNSSALCIVQNLAPPPERLFGSLDRLLEGTMPHLVDAFNSGLPQRLRGSADKLFDVAGVAETVGLANWHSPSEWNLAKLPFAQAFLPLYTDHVCRILAALRGLSRRCLIVDLDNTLWGGVIGDDGLKGIQIGEGDPAGEAYLSFQRYVLSLRDRGIVLAVCSKNEDETARLPFRNHPEMLLREEHFAVFQANWEDKATNIRAIADALSLGLDSLVFVDDNPFERNLVREALPEVATPELPHPAEYARTLSAAGYFEAVAVSEDDVKRAAFYAGNAQRAALQRQAGDIGAYLASLEMEIAFRPFDETNRARIAQLINKSNQFNLTTRRYTEADVAGMESDPEVFSLQVRLRDKLGDNGMISVIVCRVVEAGVWEIDTWLMSCRVLGRHVERAVLRELLRHAEHRRVSKLRGAYIPTGRNKLVAEHYAKLGFTLKKEHADGTTTWELDVDSAAIEPPSMVVQTFDLDPLPEAVRS